MLSYLRNLWRGLQAGEKRALAALAAGAVIFVLAQFLVLPAIDSGEKLRASLPLKEKTLRKYLNLASLIGTRETDGRTLQARLAEAETGLLDSRAAALASAELQERVKLLAEEQKIELRGADFLPAKPLKPAEAGYIGVPLALAFECTLDQFAGFLSTAAAGPKTLAIEQLSISASPPRPDRPKKMVSVRLTLRAVMAVETVPAPKS